jgi:hypothetical protein
LAIGRLFWKRALNTSALTLNVIWRILTQLEPSFPLSSKWATFYFTRLFWLVFANCGSTLPFRSPPSFLGFYDLRRRWPFGFDDKREGRWRSLALSHSTLLTSQSCCNVSSTPLLFGRHAIREKHIHYRK